jgi:hypothetical protein
MRPGRGGYRSAHRGKFHGGGGVGKRPMVFAPKRGSGVMLLHNWVGRSAWELFQRLMNR